MKEKNLEVQKGQKRAENKFKEIHQVQHSQIAIREKEEEKNLKSI